jgi:CRP/FNR family cyclic AMP-dependent transcriptional regulator
MPTVVDAALQRRPLRVNWNSVRGDFSMSELTCTAIPAWPESSLLGRLTPADQHVLVSLGRRAVFPAGEVIVRQGANDGHVVLLTKGLAKVLVNTESGHEALLAVRTGGDLIGEVAFPESRPHPATVVTCTKTSAQLIRTKLLAAVLASNPRIHCQVTLMLSERLRWADEQRAVLTALPARARFARVIVEIAGTCGHTTRGGQWELGVPLSHSELASFAGVSLSSAEKTLRELRQQGAVAHRRRVLVTDMTALRGLAGLSAPKP